MIGNGKSSFGKALFKSLKSTQTWIYPFFFIIGTMFTIHFGYFTSLMKPTSINLSIFVSICETSSGWNHFWACLIIQTPCFTMSWCTATFGSRPSISYLYNQVTTQNNFSLQKDLKAYLHRLALGFHLFLNWAILTHLQWLAPVLKYLRGFTWFIFWKFWIRVNFYYNMVASVRRTFFNIFRAFLVHPTAWRSRWYIVLLTNH